MTPEEIRPGVLLIVPAGTTGYNKRSFRVRVDEVEAVVGDLVQIVATKVRPNGQVVTEWSLGVNKVEAVRYLTVRAADVTSFTPVDRAEG